MRALVSESERPPAASARHLAPSLPHSASLPVLQCSRSASAVAVAVQCSAVQSRAVKSSEVWNAV